ETFASIKRIFDLSFFTKVDFKKYGEQPVLVFREQDIEWNATLKKSLKDNDLFRIFIEDIVKTAILKHEKYNPGQPLTLREKYTKKDVCRLLNWHKDEKGTMFGYRTKHGTC